MLYANITLCLLGPELIRFFTRNASSEGLRRVRFCHVALSMQSDKRKFKALKRRMERAILTVRDEFPSLKQLPVEVALAYGQPSDPHDFWARLRDALGVFRDLDAFVLKVSIHGRSSLSDYGISPSEILSSWDDAEYAALEEPITRKGSEFGYL